MIGKSAGCLSLRISFEFQKTGELSWLALNVHVSVPMKLVEPHRDSAGILYLNIYAYVVLLLCT
jgi:hypothetical protein